MATKSLKEKFGTINPKTVTSIIEIISALMVLSGLMFFNKTTFGLPMTVSGIILGYMSYFVHKKIK